MTRPFGLVLMGALLLSLGSRGALGQAAAPSTDDMVRQLMGPPPPASGPMRGFRVRTQDVPAEAQAAPAAEKAHPWVGVPLLFDVNSARLKPESGPVLASMARALQSPQLTGSRILIEGHTDTSGGAAHNLVLSKQRADAVKEALVRDGGVDAARLSTVGKGESGLANPDDPLAAENRRVVLVNVSR